MGVTPIDSGEDEPKLTDKTEQTSIQPSMAACVDVLSELKAARPSGQPLLAMSSPSGGPVDLGTILFKQQNEFTSPNGVDLATDPGSLRTGHMRPGVYGQVEQRLGDAPAETPDDIAMVDKPDYFADMKEVFGNSIYFDMVRNHNQVLSTPGDATMQQIMDGHTHEDGDGSRDHHHGPVDPAQLDSATAAIQAKPDEPTILFNFDSHSDMWMGPVHDQNESIAQWVNKVLENNPNVNEVYWVIPKDFKSDPELRKRYFEHEGGIPSQDSVFVHTKPDMTLYLDRESGSLSPDKPDDYSEAKYREIQLRKRTLDELPDFAGKRTAVSIDLDFFDNRGYDTAYDAAVKYSADAGFREFVQTMKDRNIRPEYTTVSASPEYVRSENIRDLMRFSALVSDSTKAPMDAVAVPSQNEVYSGTSHMGIQVDRAGVRALELTNNLFKIDAQTRRPNDQLNLNVQGDELVHALAATKSIYGVQTDEEAAQILSSLDAADGNTNGIVEFEAIESLLVRVCEATDSSERKLKKGLTSQRLPQNPEQ